MQVSNASDVTRLSVSFRYFFRGLAQVLFCRPPALHEGMVGMAKWTKARSRHYPSVYPAIIEKVCDDGRIHVTFTESFHDAVPIPNQVIAAADFAVGTSYPRNWLKSRSRDARLPDRLDEIAKTIKFLSKTKRRKPSLDRGKLGRCDLCLNVVNLFSKS